jgi:hypothetical protein
MRLTCFGEPAEMTLRKFEWIKRGFGLSTQVILLVLFLLGALPSWSYSAHWGYFPSGGAGLVLLIVIVLIFLDII